MNDLDVVDSVNHVNYAVRDVEGDFHSPQMKCRVRDFRASSMHVCIHKNHVHHKLGTGSVHKGLMAKLYITRLG